VSENALAIFTQSVNRQYSTECRIENRQLTDLEISVVIFRHCKVFSLIDALRFGSAQLNIWHAYTQDTQWVYLYTFTSDVFL